MGIPDPEGHTRHIDDWKSSDGRKKSLAGSHCQIWVFEDQASYRNITYERDPLGAWKKIADNPQIVNSWEVKGASLDRTKGPYSLCWAEHQWVRMQSFQNTLRRTYKWTWELCLARNNPL
jgi:hypothetical protein